MRGLGGGCQLNLQRQAPIIHDEALNKYALITAIRNTPHIRNPKSLIAAARRLRSNETSAEDLLWQQLRGRRLDGHKFRRQVPIAGSIADFACLALGLTIELDGRQHAQQAESDLARTERIEAAGYLELRFTNEDVRSRLDWVLQEIRRAVDVARNRSIRPFIFRADRQ